MDKCGKGVTKKSEAGWRKSTKRIRSSMTGRRRLLFKKTTRLKKRTNKRKQRRERSSKIQSMRTMSQKNKRKMRMKSMMPKNLSPRKKQQRQKYARRSGTNLSPRTPGPTGRVSEKLQTRADGRIQSPV